MASLNIETDEDGNEFVRLSKDEAVAQRQALKDAEASKAAAVDLISAQRELAFLKAGIDTDSPLGKLFSKGYDGEPTVDAIKAAAAEVPGLVGAPAEQVPATPNLSLEQIEAAKLEAEQTAARQALANGAVGNVPTEVSGITAANEVVAEARAAGRRDEVAQGAGIAALADAALRGDKSVLVQDRVDN